jgi:hypothetical protein
LESQPTAGISILLLTLAPAEMLALAQSTAEADADPALVL